MLAIVALVQTARLERRKRQHERELEHLRHELDVDAKKNEILFVEHRALADRLLESIFQLSDSIAELDAMFNAFYIHMHRADVLEDNLQLVSERIENLVGLRKDALKLGQQYPDRLHEVVKAAQALWEEVDRRAFVARAKGDPTGVHELSPTEWTVYGQLSRASRETNRRVILELSIFLGARQ